MNDTPLNLTQAFIETNTLTWGDFKIVKSPDQSFDEAEFSVKNKVIPLTRNEMKFMSLLIAYQGQSVPRLVFRDELAITALEESTAKRYKNSLANNLCVYASKIRAKIRKVVGDESADMIRTSNRHRKLGETGPWIKDLKSNYRLLPVPAEPAPVL